jgi:dihydroorotase
MSVTAEVTPHHLMLTDDLVESYDPIYKVNPPLRTMDDVQALREGLADGTIDIVATDHAPHADEDKDCEWSAAAFGMIGLETALSVTATAMISTKLMDWNSLAVRMSTKPAQIGGYTNHGVIAVGAHANLTAIDTEARWKVNREESLSKSRNTPFHGQELVGKVMDTFFNGVQVLAHGSLTGNKHE